MLNLLGTIVRQIALLEYIEYHRTKMKIFYSFHWFVQFIHSKFMGGEINNETNREENPIVRII